jgi:molecular chaperone DnaK
MARDNRTLGRFHLDGIPLAPRGVPQIEVTFDIDANGIVNVSAKDKGTGKEQKITITASSGLSKDEVDRMMREAESHAAEDKRRKEEVETRNQADQTVYGTEKMLREMGEKVGAADRAAIEAAINDVKSATEKNEPAAIKSALERLTAAQHKLAESLYAQAGAAGAAGQPGSGAGPDGGAAPGSGAKDDVIDAEVVDEGKK